MRGADDDDLVRGARQGEKAAFATLLERYQDRVYRTARRLCGEADAEEVVQVCPQSCI